MKFLVEYTMFWAGKVVRNDIVEVEAPNSFRAEKHVIEEMKKLNRKALINIDEVVAV